MANPFNPENWYWFIAGDINHVWGSAAQELVAITDSTYFAWLAAGNITIGIDSYDSLYGVLLVRAPDIAALVAGAWVAAGYLDPQTSYNYLVSVGCQVTSTANPSTLNGTYPIDTDTLALYDGVMASINSDKGLPGGGSTFNLLDIEGNFHPIGASDFTNLAEALRNYIYDLAVCLMALLGSHTATWPTQPVAIA
jgi:hypothetical protein